MISLPKKEEREAARRTIARYPILIDYFIRHKEENGERAKAISDEKVAHAQEIFLHNFTQLVELLNQQTEFYKKSGNTFDEALARVRYLKQVIENNDGYRLFYDSHGLPIKREEDIQVAFRFTWFGTILDVNREVNNGRGPVDYKVSMGAADSALVEFKLASNTQLKRNLEKQVEIYERANQTKKSIKVILFFDAFEQARIEALLNDLGLIGKEEIVLIDARRDNKPSGSKA